MTKPLNLMNPEDALYAACRAFPGSPGGIAALAERRGISAAALYQKLDKDNERGRITFGAELDDILDQLRAAGVPNWDAPLCALAYRHGGVFVRLPEIEGGQSAQELTQGILDMVRDQGRLATVLAESLANDQEIDTREFEAFNVCHAAAMASVAKMGEHVRELHERAKAAGRVR